MMHLGRHRNTMYQVDVESETESESESEIEDVTEESTILPFVVKLSSCLSKVEKLMTTMLFRFHNNRVLSMVATRISLKESQRRHFESGRLATQIPYAGPNFNELCPFTDEERVVVKDIPNDQRYAKIIAEYEESLLDEKLRETHRCSENRKRQEQINNIITQEKLAKRKFCADVIERMRRWTIWSDANVNITPNIFHNRENMQGFLNRVGHLLIDDKR
ncbi:uncharacterized protein LOC128263260 isoform X2 [Drosophila gunungcola]|uniref:uncharacterized protein LOC128263260 isoform X2 n=1 Tax=Drosophila gunungcola TaxID=103775 RepID=UPI0022E6E582|nr:uncharacterized protein LOC128263260 isoform X2 [Drosophila gunungcola]